MGRGWWLQASSQRGLRTERTVSPGTESRRLVVDLTAPTVFMSYAHANEERVRTVASRLRGWGYEVWIDQIDLDAGSDWRASIEEKIPVVDYFVLALSRSSTKSEIVEWELDVAERAGTKIVPIVFGTGKGSAALGDRLGSLHHISFSTSNERGMAALVEALGGIRNNQPVLADQVDFPAIGENARMVAEMVRFLQEFSKTGGAVIFYGGRDDGYFVQLLIEASQSEVYGEAVGNDNLEGDALLDQDQLATLANLGWGVPSRESYGNHRRVWHANSDRDRSLIAGDVVRTFLDAFDHPKGGRLRFELQADD
jgi:hypothetical protein